MIIEKISLVTTGQLCINCGARKLYKLKDNRVKCSSCNSRYSLPKLSLDLWSLYYFSIEATAHKTAKELKVNYRTILTRFNNFRRKIAQYQEENFRILRGEIECDESYFGGRRKYLRGRAKSNKVIVLGLLERKGKIHTTVVENVTANSLLEEIKASSEKGSVFYTDQFKSYKSLKFYRKHLTVDHQKTFGRGKNNINGLEGFWSYAKERLLKYHGVSKNNFILYLKEIEFRYNFRKQDIFKLLLEIIYNFRL